MWILGLNAYHGDSSACLIKNGELIAAAEEERFKRIKHWAGFPSEAIRFCLKEGKIKLSDLHIVAINSNAKANLLQRIFFLLRHPVKLNFLLERLKNQKARLSIVDKLNQISSADVFNGKIYRAEHHLAHLSSAFHVSPFEEAAVVSIDGFGDFSSFAWGIGKNDNIKIKERIYFPHSMGAFYQALTQFLGFPNYGDEYKIMGLAPYGKPTYLNQMRQLVRTNKNGGYSLNLKYFRFHREKIKYTWDNGLPEIDNLFSKEMADLLGNPRKKDEPLTQHHFDIAQSTQILYEEVFFNILNTIHKNYPSKNLALAGGCGMNSVANGKISQNTSFSNVYIPPAAGDAGGSIGAALVAWNQFKPSQYKNKKSISFHAYCGPQFSNDEIEKIIQSNLTALQNNNCRFEMIENEDALCKKTADAITEGKIIGWFQGRMEWGPRALGNRSIICDARRKDMKDILNSKIKRRESFRPFAPSILREQVSAWFEIDDDVPYMMKVFKIKEDKRHLIPAVTHVDGTGRLQTVHAETNARYYKLISCFADNTGVPIILNTSFNENEPVVCKPEEALDCFLRTKMDVLVLGNTYIWRND